MNLTNKQKLYLKSVAHHLKPIVQVGNNGLTEAVIAEVDYALAYHELIKVKIATDNRETKQLIADAIVRETASVEVQIIGHTLTLYRPSKEAKIKLPR